MLGPRPARTFPEKLREVLRRPAPSLASLTGIYTLDTASFAVATNTWYRLRLENVGSTLRGYIDNQLVVEATDPTPIPQSALQGSALVLYKTAAQYDNWRMTQP